MARGEAYSLKAENIVGIRVMFTLTKNGERRVVPLSDDIARKIKDRESGRLFRVSYKTFRLRMKEAKPNLPDGQAAHALRHTFATHFMMKGATSLLYSESWVMRIFLKRWFMHTSHQIIYWTL